MFHEQIFLFVVFSMSFCCFCFVFVFFLFFFVVVFLHQTVYIKYICCMIFQKQTEYEELVWYFQYQITPIGNRNLR